MPSATRNRFAGREHLKALSAPWGERVGKFLRRAVKLRLPEGRCLMKDEVSDLAAALIDLRGELRG